MKKESLREVTRPAQNYTAGWQWARPKILISMIYKIRVPLFHYASLSPLGPCASSYFLHTEERLF